MKAIVLHALNSLRVVLQANLLLSITLLLGVAEGLRDLVRSSDLVGFWLRDWGHGYLLDEVEVVIYCDLSISSVVCHHSIDQTVC